MLFLKAVDISTDFMGESKDNKANVGDETRPCYRIFFLTFQGGTCINTDGSYRCECPSGFKLDHNGKKCVDDNECLSNPRICGNGTCSNIIGGFECSCTEGYAPGPHGNCEDVDECTEYGHQVRAKPLEARIFLDLFRGDG